MSPLALMAHARVRGLRISAEGGVLVCEGPLSAMTPSLRAELAAAKGPLLALLRATADTADGCYLVPPDADPDADIPAVAEDIPGPTDRGQIWINPEAYSEVHWPPRREADAWRWEVACWPHDRWVAWRRRSTELQPPWPRAAVIAEADYVAYLEVAATP